MELSPTSIARAEFATVRKGYAPEVRAHLGEIAWAVSELQTRVANAEAAARFATEHLGAIVSGGVVSAEVAPVLLATVVVCFATLLQIAALLVMRLAAFGPMKEGVAKQFAIFRNKHTWSMTALYIVTFGSFIGFSMALPLCMKVIFGVSHVRDAAGVLGRCCRVVCRRDHQRWCVDVGEI